MAWYDVTIDTIQLTWVKPDVEIDREGHTIKIAAAAILEYVGDDPVTEIAALNALSSRTINNTFPLLNGGSKLQAENIFPVVVNGETFQKCALHPIPTPIDGFYNSDSEGSSIDYELNLEYEADGLGSSSVYIAPKYPTAYSELDYHFYYDYMTGEVWDQPTTGLNYGTEGGIWTFTMDGDVKRVEVYGSGDLDILGTGRSPYIELNKSDQKIWHFYEAQDGVKLKQLEKFSWDLDTELIVSDDLSVGGTSLLVNPVKGGILDNTILSLISGTGPAAISVNGDHEHLSESLTVDAVGADVVGGAVYGIDRTVVVLSTNQKVPDETHIPINILADAAQGATSISITPLYNDVSDNHIFYRVSGTGPSQIVVNGYHNAGDGSIDVDALTENLVSGALYKMTVNLGCYLEWIRLVYE